jgi:hypothetical protein
MPTVQRFLRDLVTHVLQRSPATALPRAIWRVRSDERVYIDSGALAWPGDIDLTPDAMYARIALEQDKQPGYPESSAPIAVLCNAKFGRSVLSRLYDNLDIVPQRYQETHEALDRISAELTSQHS